MSTNDQIILFQPRRAFGVPNPSPFCIKLETWLRVAELPYEIKPIVDPRKGPTGKVPFVTVGGGAAIGDTEIIIETLSERFGVDIDKGLSAADRAVAHAFRRMLEEHLYWIQVHSRWLEDAPFEVIRPAFFSGLPPVLRQMLPPVARRGVRKTIHAQGLGRHPRKTIYAKGEADLAAISEYLGKKPYLMGGTPRVVDCAAYGVLASIIDAQIETPMRPIGRGFKNLVAYTARMREAYFTDLDAETKAA